MDSTLKGLNINTWYKVLIAVATVVLVAAVTTGRANVALAATAAVMFGIGQWINHPKRIGVTLNYKVTYTSRAACPLGLLVEASALALGVHAIWRLSTLGL